MTFPDSPCRQPSSTLPPQLRDFIAYGLLVLAVLLAYGNVFDNAMLYDDQHLIIQNEYLRGWSHLSDIFLNYVGTGASHFGQFYRPLENVTYLIIYQLAGGLSLFAFHFLNLGFHTLNACLIFKLANKLNVNLGASFLASLLWVVHPLHTEVVTYMAGTPDLQYTCLCLIGLILLTPDFTRRKFIRVVPIFILGLLTKEAALIFPFLTMATAAFIIKPKDLRRTAAEPSLYGLWSPSISPYANFWLLYVGATIGTRLPQHNITEPMSWRGSIPIWRHFRFMDASSFCRWASIWIAIFQRT